MAAVMTMQMATCPERSADCTFTTCNAYCNAVHVPPSIAQPTTTACIYTDNKVEWHALAQTMQPPLYANRTAYAGYLHMQYQQMHDASCSHSSQALGKLSDNNHTYNKQAPQHNTRMCSNSAPSTAHKDNDLGTFIAILASKVSTYKQHTCPVTRTP